ncbi:MAG: PilZ domain-containing protein [Deltaproteobacteria bacterium]|nr:PilZ domain-containing protein [Deltaproteobacteria bacterium]MBN2674784.1 PilZ domain-containing protein [Deltaproteobacteria bacterium]
MTKKTERRTSARCIANCQCWIEQESVTLFGTVTNLSPHGLFLQTLPIIETGTEIDIRLSLQDVGDLLAKGRVAWKSNSHSPSHDNNRSIGVPGLGIEFSQINQGKELLPEYISKRSVAPPPPEKKL